MEFNDIKEEKCLTKKNRERSDKKDGVDGKTKKLEERSS